MWKSVSFISKHHTDDLNAILQCHRTNGEKAKSQRQPTVKLTENAWHTTGFFCKKTSTLWNSEITICSSPPNRWAWIYTNLWVEFWVVPSSAAVSPRKKCNWISGWLEGALDLELKHVCLLLGQLGHLLADGFDQGGRGEVGEGVVGHGELERVG